MKGPNEQVGPSLVLVATPIGNLGDITPRALEELAEADVVACEDTRRTGSLFSHFGIEHAPFIVCNEHTERAASDRVVDLLAAGKTVALVSDAGTPAVSDPGQRLVEAVIEAGMAGAALLRHFLLDSCLRHSHRGRPWQPAWRHSRGSRHRCAGTVRCAYLRYRFQQAVAVMLLLLVLLYRLIQQRRNRQVLK